MFPTLARTGEDGQPLVFADAPGGSQVPDVVIDAVTSHYRRGMSNTHGAFETSQDTDRVIANARRAAADMTGADPNEIVFGPNATTLLFHLSRSFGRTLGPGDEVVVTRLDHDANVRPWVLAATDAGATIRWVDVREDDVTLDIASFEAALSTRTKLVAFTLASNAVGTIPPAADLVARAKAVGALVAVDGVHLAQHRLLDLHGTRCRPPRLFSVQVLRTTSGHRRGSAGAPRALGAVQARPGPGRSTRAVGDRHAESRRVGRAERGRGVPRRCRRRIWRPRREQLRDSYSAIAAHERTLADRFLEGIGDIPGVRLWGIADRARLDERTPTFAIRVGDEHPADTAKRLAEMGIFAWDGDYYAREIMTRLGLFATGGAVRIGFCHYHSDQEVDRVLEVIASLSRGS